MTFKTQGLVPDIHATSTASVSALDMLHLVANAQQILQGAQGIHKALSRSPAKFVNIIIKQRLNEEMAFGKAISPSAGRTARTPGRLD